MDGTRQAPSTRGRHSPYIRPMPIRRPTAAPAALGALPLSVTGRPALPFRQPAPSMRVTTHSMTWSSVSSVVSTSTASSALASGEVFRPESAASRLTSASRVAARSAASLPLSSPLRRAARASGEAVRNTLRSASGRTVMPMSRPSTTMPFGASAAMLRCRSVIRVRTSGTALTALTAAVTSWVRIGPAASRPSTVMVGAAGSVPETITGLAAASATAVASLTSIPLVSIHQVIARYWAPVSR